MTVWFSPVCKCKIEYDENLTVIHTEKCDTHKDVADVNIISTITQLCEQAYEEQQNA